MSPAELSGSEAERLRAFERQGHDAPATSYHAFFAAVTALAINPLLDAVRLRSGARLLDVATGAGGRSGAFVVAIHPERWKTNVVRKRMASSRHRRPRNTR